MGKRKMGARGKRKEGRGGVKEGRNGGIESSWTEMGRRAEGAGSLFSVSTGLLWGGAEALFGGDGGKGRKGEGLSPLFYIFIFEGEARPCCGGS